MPDSPLGLLMNILVMSFSRFPNIRHIASVLTLVLALCLMQSGSLWQNLYTLTTDANPSGHLVTDVANDAQLQSSEQPCEGTKHLLKAADLDSKIFIAVFVFGLLLSLFYSNTIAALCYRSSSPPQKHRRHLIHCCFLE